jgi:hypothetical protein
MTNISKEDILKKHLPYEIDMLRQTYRKLKQGPLPEWAVNNALIESFCIHARSLSDFFGNCRSKPDDFIAADFTNTPATRFNIPAALRTKLNKEIFHLTGARKNIEADQFNMRTDGKQLIDELEQEIRRFEVCLPANFKKIFRCNIPPVTQSETTSFKGPVNSTTALGGSLSVTWSSHSAKPRS